MSIPSELLKAEEREKARMAVVWRVAMATRGRIETALAGCARRTERARERENISDGFNVGVGMGGVEDF